MAEKQSINSKEIEEIFGGRFEKDQKGKSAALNTVLNRKTIKANPFPNPYSLYAISLYTLASIYPRHKSKEKTAYFLATILENLENLSSYLTLVHHRRADFVKNCLLITKTRLDEGKIKGSKAKYFWGIIRSRTKQLEALKKYKRKKS